MAEQTFEQRILGELHTISTRLATIEANQKIIHQAVVDQGQRITKIERDHSDMPLYPTPTPQPLGDAGDGGEP